jgi:CRP/FNR family nitrogen fixation transcriptional regulator
MQLHSRISAAGAQANGIVLRAEMQGFRVTTGGLAALEDLGVPVVVRKGADIWGQGDEAPYAYRIISGCVRLVKLMEDGRRQITAFLGAGDWLGLERIEAHHCAAEGVTGCVLRRYARRQVDALVAQDTGLARWQLDMMSRSLCQAQERMLTLGRRTAMERIATFLLDMEERLGTERSGSIPLLMCRTDIGDYLGVRLETVCRILSQLQRAHAIRLTRTGFAIANRQVLEAAALAGMN